VSADARLRSVAGQWMLLRAGSRDTGGLEIPSLPLGTGTTSGPIRLAVGPNGEARVLLPITGRESPFRIDAGSALAMTASTFMQSGRVHRFLDLMCLSGELEPVFVEVVDEIIARVSNGLGCIEAVRATFDDFRTLLTARASDRIDRSRIAGLVAELVVLNRLLDLAPSAWRAWRGPAGDRHDFRAADASLEVKASLRAGSVEITVNGIEQLEAPSDGTLHLAHFVLEPVKGGPLTIASLGGRAFAQADEPNELRDLLASIGCLSVQSDDWNRDAFRIESESLYRVAGDFPRIVPSHFRGGNALAGIREVTYRVDLSFAAICKCPPDGLEALLCMLAR